MSLVDRFICRREGHLPAFELKVPPGFVESYITTCRRCGKVFEVKMAEGARSGTRSR